MLVALTVVTIVRAGPDGVARRLRTAGAVSARPTRVRPDVRITGLRRLLVGVETFHLAVL